MTEYLNSELDVPVSGNPSNKITPHKNSHPTKANKSTIENLQEK